MAKPEVCVLPGGGCGDGFAQRGWTTEVRFWLGGRTVSEEVPYKDYWLTPIAWESENGKYRGKIEVRRPEGFQEILYGEDFPADWVFDSEEEAIKAALALGKKIVDERTRPAGDFG